MTQEIGLMTDLSSLVLGRPPSISDSYTDALAPSNVELSDYDPVTGSAHISSLVTLASKRENGY
jgi:hypothetical protein